MATTFTDLPMDVSSQIIYAVAKSQNGAQIVAQSMPFSQHFLEASNNDAILRAVCFQNVHVLGRTHLFQSTKGLLYKCAKAGNPTAVHLLAKVIIATSAQLLKINMKKERLKYFHGFKPKYKSDCGKARKDAVVASFMAHFTPEPGSHPTPSSDALVPSFHWEFVRAFLLKCTPHEIRQMQPYLEAYVKLFDGVRIPYHISNIWFCFRMMCLFAKANEQRRAGAEFEMIRMRALQYFNALIRKLQ